MNIIQKIYKSLQFRYQHATRKKDEEKRINYLTEYSKFEAEDNIYLFTDPRSGSTWLMEILNQIPKTATLWEPFHPNNGTVDQSFNLGWRPFLEKDSKNEELRRHLVDVFSFKKATRWTVSQNRFLEYKRANTLIVKSVRSNALLPWFTNNFKLKYKPIYFLRHPIAQSISHIQAFSDNKDIWAKERNGFKGINESLLKTHESFLRSLNTQIENRMAVWCLTNKTALENKNVDYFRVYYEDLLLHPENTLTKIFKGLGLPNIKKNVDFKKPSWTTSKTFQDDAISQLKKWGNKIDDHGKEKLNRILIYFNLDNIYSAFEYLPIDSLKK